MDEPLRLPPLFDAKPPRQEVLLQGPFESEHGTMHGFDPASQSSPTCPAFSGIRLYPDAISGGEESQLLEEIGRRPFALAQSGKWKQHFGAKINFNKRRMNIQGFRGLPPSAKWIEEIALNCVEADATRDDLCSRAVASFKTTDFFALRYDAAEGSNLDFHTDDRFGYGEAIFDLSLESDSVLTFIRPRETNTQDFEGELRPAKPAPPRGPVDCVRVPLPARSIAVLYGAARFQWKHAILARDIRQRRTSITLRTLSDEVRQTEAGREILALAEKRVSSEDDNSIERFP